MGNTIVKKIEEYKIENDTLPISLAEIGQDEMNDGVLFCYEKIDSINYIVWFGTALGEGMYYFSDTRKWEDQLRSVSNLDGTGDSTVPTKRGMGQGTGTCPNKKKKITNN